MVKKTKIVSIIILIAVIAIAVLAIASIIAYMHCRDGSCTGSLATTLKKTPVENGTFRVCFSMQENCTILLVSLIKNASKVKAALYDLDEKNIISALQEKNSDIIIDEDNFFGYGKKITTPGLMHNKFFIIYNSSGKDFVVTGSTNPTNNDLYKNDNNMEIISSSFLMKNYEEQFSQIKSNMPKRQTAFQNIIFNSEKLCNYFCPEDLCEEKVIEEISKAQKSVYFMAFSFTSDKIGNLLVSKKTMLDIKGVFDAGQSKTDREYSEYPKMVHNSMKVALDGSKGKLHHKVFIIDNRTVIAGSYNPTSSGNTRNDENIIVINDREIVQDFVEEFNRVANLAGLV